MVVSAMALLAAAAVLHAAWNIMLQIRADPLQIACGAVWASAALWTVPAVLAWLLTGRPSLASGTVILAIASAGCEVVYFHALSEAYRRGTLIEVYAVARGSAPLLATLAGIVILAERPDPTEVAGVVLLIVGIWTVRRPGAITFATTAALLTGVMIAAYTTVDSVGVHQAPAWMYGYVVWVLTAAFLVVASRFAPRRPQPEPTQRSRVQVPTLGRTTVIIGLFMTVTYLMVLAALRMAPLYVVSPLRESAIVMVAIWSTWQERDRRGLTLAGAGLIAMGATLVALA